MKTLYLDCSMGAAGDMLTGALLELLPDPAAFVAELNALGLPGVVFRADPSEKCGVTGTHMTVTVNGEEEESLDHHEHDSHDHEHPHEHPHDSHDHDHDHDSHDHDSHDHHHDHEHEHEHDHDHPHHHSSLHDIEHLITQHARLPEAVRRDVLAVYGLIAQAESKAHGRPVEEIHFHEVGTLDAIADVTAVCLLLHRLAPDRVVAGPVHVGSGQVRCAHGILPVPAPATATLLTGVPIYGGAIQGELCTPTGAALLRHFVGEFGPMPLMIPEKTGYGMGKKDFPAANCVRALWGESPESPEEIVELACNLDDTTPEDLGYALDALLAAGARDAFTTPAGMKKNRPGVVLTVLCDAHKARELAACLFRLTGTIGVRETPVRRYTLTRSVETVDTSFGPVRRKISAGYGVTRAKWEFDDLARIAREQGLSPAQVRARLDREHPAPERAEGAAAR